MLDFLKSSGYPPVGFSFKVTFTITGAMGLFDTDFQEVSGITSEVDIQDFKEGGENRYTHKLPSGLKKSNLVLKRGIAKITSPLVIWCKSVFEGDFILPVLPQPIIVTLQDENGMPLMVWSFANAWPVKWEVSQFDAMKGEVAIETIELAYNYSNRLI